MFIYEVTSSISNKIMPNLNTDDTDQDENSKLSLTTKQI